MPSAAAAKLEAQSRNVGMKLSVNIGKINLSVGLDRSNPRTLRRSIAADPIQAWLRGEDGDWASASPLLTSPFQQSVWVYTAVCALAQTISAIPFRISHGDRSGEKIISEGPVVDLFNRPHPFLNRFRFWEFIVTWYCLRGEAFIVALDKSGAVLPIHRSPSPSQSGRGARGEGSAPSSSSSIRSLLVLPPDRFRHIVENSELLGWRFTASPLSNPLPSMALVPDEVIHDFLPNPYLFWRGMSPLSVALLAAQTDFASAQFMKGLMLNNADAGVIVRSDEQLGEEQRESLLSALRERKRSAGTADRPLLLWGTTEVIQPALSSADLQFLENRKMNRQEICAAFFRIPQSLVGFTENANRSIAESERLNFLENSITPLCARLEAAIEPVVKAFGADLVGWFDVESTAIMQSARRSRVDTGVKLFSLGYPANAINKSLDLGLPNLPWGDQGYLPALLEPAGQTPPPVPSPTTQSATPIERLLETLTQIAGSRPDRGSPSRSTFDKPAAPPDHTVVAQRVLACVPGRTGVPPVPLKPITDSLITDYSHYENSHHAPRSHANSAAHAYAAALQPRIKQKLSKLRSFFFAQRNRVLDNLENLTKTVPQPSDGGTESPSPSHTASPRPSDGRGIKGEGNGEWRGVRGEGSDHASRFTLQAPSTHHLLFDPAEETKLLFQKLAPSFRADLELGFRMIAEELSLNDSSLSPEQALPLLSEREKSLIHVNESTLKELTASVLEGLRNHESFKQLAGRVKAIFQDASDRRAPAIAETETNSAVNAGRLMAMRAAKVQKKRWQTAEDEKVRPAHALAGAAYAEGIPVDEPFIVGGEALMYPGDPHGSIGNIINCRCYSFPVLEDQ